MKNLPESHNIKIALLIIGNEILAGKIQDLNTSWLSKFLTIHQLNLHQVVITSDDENLLALQISTLLHDYDLVITSGGLGPTLDDVTKVALAKALGGRKIVYNRRAHEMANHHFQRIGRPAISEDHCYAQMPEGVEAIPNPCGLANGLNFTDHEKKKMLLSLPGVPREFKEMWEEECYPLMKKFFWPESGDHSDWQKDIIIRTHSQPEEKIFTQLDPTLWQKLSTFGQVSSLPHLLAVDIGVRITAKTEAHLQEKEKSIKQVLRASPVHPFIWQIGDQPLNEYLVQMLKEKNLSLGFAESCTGGLLGHMITDVAGSSEVFKGSLVTYQNSIKENILGVKSESLEKYLAVSTEVAKEMCRGVKERLGCDVAISTTGYAGPGGGDDHHPVGTVIIGLSRNGHNKNNDVEVFTFKFFGDRRKLKEVFATKALFILWEYLHGTNI